VTQFSVQDGHDGRTRKLVFDGELVGEVSSRRQAGPRWTELRLYKTNAGAYVLEKVGMSVVVHGPGCPEIKGDLPRFQAAYPGGDPADGSWWICEVCGSSAVRDITRLLVETNRHWAVIAEDPAQIVDALYRRKLGARSMPRMSIDLLDQAGRIDPVIAEAFRSEFVS
jgi:hypothetical protein